jgi:hypothetical protein
MTGTQHTGIPKKGDSCVLVSFVGMQPAAIAVAARTWAKTFGPPRALYLLLTPEVAAERRRPSIFNRLQVLLSTTGSEPVALERVDLRAQDAYQTLKQQAVLASLDGARLVYLLDAGPGWRIAKLARDFALNGLDPVLVSATDQHLVVTAGA